MSPKNPSSSANARASAAPYSRRATGQPKSSRQQFSACGACRMRRVRCDLKDLAMVGSGPHPPCSNCKERGLKCVDEFADVKAVKLLRRGRRLQQVEAIYGKTEDEHPSTSSNSGPSPPVTPRSSQPATSTTPHIKPEFFSSRFWRRFCMQRPLLTDFSARYFAHLKGAPVLSSEGRLLGMVLVAWAASFGVDERGVEIDQADFTANAPSNGGEDTIGASVKSRRQGERLLALAASPLPRHPHQRSRILRERTSPMVREILGHIDRLGILRHPTWDGVRILLLVLGIAEDVQLPLDRLAMQEAALSQVYTLCSLASLTSSSSINPSNEPEAEVRARVFWYAHVHESVTIGLRGGRLIFDEDDLETFKASLPPVPLPMSSSSSATPPSLPSPVSPTFPSHPNTSYPGTQQPHHDMASHHLTQQQHQGSIYHHDNRRYPMPNHSNNRTAHPHLLSAHLFSLPLRLSTVCRKAHQALTGPKARRAGVIDEEAMFAVWDGLDRCWEDFEQLKRGGGVAGVGSKDDVERFAGGWQIFIFECFNLVRESLKQRLLANSTPTANGVPSPDPNRVYPGSTAPSPSNSHSHPSRSPHSSTSNSPTASTFPPSQASLAHLHAVGQRKCQDLLPRVLHIIRRHVTVSEAENGTGLFKWDAGLVRDGCFFAAFLVAGGEGELQKWPSKRDYDNGGIDAAELLVNQEEGIELCLRALEEMQWAFSKNEERGHTVRMVWDLKRARGRRQGSEYTQRQEMEVDDSYAHHQQRTYDHHQHHHNHGAFAAKATHIAPLLPPLSLVTDSAEPVHVGCNGHAAWGTYTPPGTGTTMSGSPSTGRASPGYSTMASNLGSFKAGEPTMGGSGDFYVGPELDTFTYNVPTTECSDPSSSGYSLRHNQERHLPSSMAPNMGGGQGHGYLDPVVVFAGPVTTGEDAGAPCPQFSGDCHAFYH